MPYTVPTTSDFTTRYPELAEVDAGVIGALLTFASTFVDINWFEFDYQPAILSLAAHFVALEKERIDAEAGDVGGGTSGIETYMRTISFGDRTLGFGAAGARESGGGAAASLASLMAGFGQTPYGQVFSLLLRRNAPMVLVLDGGGSG